MAILPTEIWTKICQQLCYHCCQQGSHPLKPRIITDFGSSEARQNKTTLARICRASKSLNAIAQVPLYHYFATGNAPRRDTQSRGGLWSQTAPERDYLTRFLRTILRRPDLAKDIVLLQLFESDNIEDFMPEVKSSLIEASHLFGIQPPPEDVLEHLGRDEPKIYSQNQTARGIHGWLELLAMLSSPNLEELLISKDFPSGYDEFLGLSSQVRLTNLSTMAIRHYKFDFHICEAEKLFQIAPNLTNLYITDCAGLSDEHALARWEESWEFKLNNLRKLSIHDIAPQDLVRILNACPSLEELECSHGRGWAHSEIQDVKAAIFSIRSKLRRLAFAITPTKRTEIYPPVDYELCIPQYYEPISSFRDFSIMEVVEVDQAAVYPLSQQLPAEVPQRLVHMLPRSLRILHICFIHCWEVIFRDLLDLAESLANYNFPKLEVVRIDPNGSVPQSDVKSLEAAFGRNKIDFMIGTNSSFNIDYQVDLFGGYATTSSYPLA
jgi:hypothetical protein